MKSDQRFMLVVTPGRIWLLIAVILVAWWLYYALDLIAAYNLKWAMPRAMWEAATPGERLARHALLLWGAVGAMGAIVRSARKEYVDRLPIAPMVEPRPPH